MIKGIAKKIFGTRNERLLKEYVRTVMLINELEASISPLSDEELKNKTIEFKQRLANNEELKSLLPEAFAVCREASKRVLNMRHFDVQLIGGMVLNDNKIAEMRTGEGKTLVATLPSYLNALTGNGVHVVTVNDYLARRDAEQMRPLFNFLGMEIGINLSNMDSSAKQAAYNSDITYGTNNEFGFDYLRDNMVFDANEKVQRKLNFAIVDEVDSILIDEARTPLIISGAADGSSELYLKLNVVPPMLKPQEKEDSEEGDFFVDEKDKNVILSEKGHERVEQILIDIGLIKEGDSLYGVHNISLMHHLLAAMKAHYLYSRDDHYVVQDGEVVIVDEFTGRLMAGRRWSDGLHQAVEAKEGVSIQRENQTMASITFQNYFRMYKKLSGMTGTADTEAYEFQSIYSLETVVIPTNRPMTRKDYNDKIYMTMEEKYAAIIHDVKDCVKRGQPVLIGTTSVENSEVLSDLLTQAKVEHAVLNAKQHAREADIIEQAGRIGNVTVATNMAGRGTDIILGGSIKSLLKAIDSDESLNEEQKAQAKAELQQNWVVSNKQVLDAGGLYIIGTERHESRRVDNQLRGRAGRQGDAGTSRFYLSLDDQLLRIFGGEKMRTMMSRLGMEKGEAIEHRFLSRSIEGAQRKVEGHNFDIRKQLLEYDDVSNDQRKVIYEQRESVLLAPELSDITHNMVRSVLAEQFDTHIIAGAPEDMWDVETFDKILKNEYLLDFSVVEKLKETPNANPEDIKNSLQEFAINVYKDKLAKFQERIEFEIGNFVNAMVPEDKANWNFEAIDDFAFQNGLTTENDFVVDFAETELPREEIVVKILNQILPLMIGLQVTRFERGVILQHMDFHWREHLTQLDQLRQGIGLRGYAQKNPKQEYKQESFALFASMLDAMKHDIAKVLLTARLQSMADIPVEDEMSEIEDVNIVLSHEELEANVKVNEIAAERKIGRNEICPCGSGKKYKHCHGALV